MKSLYSLIAILSFLLTPPAAWGLFEIRGSYELLDSSGVKDHDDNVPNMKMPAGLSADVLTSVLGIVAGVRYQNLTENKSTGAGSAYEAKYNRTSLVGSYRFLDSEFYLGPIVTLGLNSNIDYTYTPTSGATSKLESGTTSSYSIGVDGGFQAFGFLVGAEVGYLSAKIGNLKNKNGGGEVLVGGTPISADMSGVYTRIMAGYSF